MSGVRRDLGTGPQVPTEGRSGHPDPYDRPDHKRLGSWRWAGHAGARLRRWDLPGRSTGQACCKFHFAGYQVR